MYSKEEIKSIVYDAVRCVTKVELVTDDVNLLERTMKIFPADFLYIFDVIERKIGIEITCVLSKHNYDVFKFSKLVDAIYGVYLRKLQISVR